jgi:pimeloyl-ACP methyl ester carboxylesterase
VLLHGFPYDVRSFLDTAPLLVDAGLRVIVPYLRGHGPTRFAAADVVRSGQQAALGADLLALIDALELDVPILAGYDWGGRAACVAAALSPERVGGLVSVNGYLIQDIAAAGTPAYPELEAGFWYFWYFSTDRGRAGLTANRRDIARVIWRRNSPEWRFDEDRLAATARSFDNPDYVDVVIHSYRHRLGLAPGDARYAVMETKLAALPEIAVPTITLDGAADGNFPATDGRAYARRFTGWHEHRIVPHAGHDLPAEAPLPFADAVTTVAGLFGR